jgi:hypothetical protein
VTAVRPKKINETNARICQSGAPSEKFADAGIEKAKIHGKKTALGY